MRHTCIFHFRDQVCLTTYMHAHTLGDERIRVHAVILVALCSTLISTRMHAQAPKVASEAKAAASKAATSKATASTATAPKAAPQAQSKATASKSPIPSPILLAL